VLTEERRVFPDLDALCAHLLTAHRDTQAARRRQRESGPVLHERLRVNLSLVVAPKDDHDDHIIEVKPLSIADFDRNSSESILSREGSLANSNANSPGGERSSHNIPMWSASGSRQLSDDLASPSQGGGEVGIGVLLPPRAGSLGTSLLAHPVRTGIGDFGSLTATEEFVCEAVSLDE
jgi:hypothetical protein